MKSTELNNIPLFPPTPIPAPSWGLPAWSTTQPAIGNSTMYPFTSYGATPSFCPPVIPSLRPFSPERSQSPAPVRPPPRVSTPPPPPVIHSGIICDKCNGTVEGVRHKCLDCPGMSPSGVNFDRCLPYCQDYDLCTSCFDSGAAENHNPFHEFFDIREPGRVIVHTVFNGDGPRDIPTSDNARAPVPVQSEQPAVHHATCDLCDSRIIGDRYVSRLFFLSFEWPDTDTVWY